MYGQIYKQCVAIYRCQAVHCYFAVIGLPIGFPTGLPTGWFIGLPTGLPIGLLIGWPIGLPIGWPIGLHIRCAFRSFAEPGLQAAASAAELQNSMIRGVEKRMQWILMEFANQESPNNIFLGLGVRQGWAGCGRV